MVFSPAQFNFTDRVAIVTGGATGIGRATSLLFARHGARVAIGDINLEGANTAELIKSSGGEALFVKTDVREVGQVQNLVATTVKRYGALHFAFNNAGILSVAAPLAELEEQSFDEVIAVDLKGVFLCMKYEILHMLKSGGGVIVNNASIAGIIADPGIGPYVAAKHGVIGLSTAAAL